MGTSIVAACGPHRWVIDKDSLSYAFRRKGLEFSLDGARRLAAAIGCSEGTVYRLVSGKDGCPSAQVLLDMAEALGCDALDLVRKSFAASAPRKA